MILSTYDKTDYSGGLNSTASLREIAPNEATVLQNWDITYQGQLRRRDGLTLIGGVPNSPNTGFGAFIRDTGIDLLRSWGTNLEFLSGVTWQALANNIVAGNPLWMENVQVNGKLYIGNTDNALKSWDRSSTTLNSALVAPTNSSNPVPHGNVMIWFNNFMFILNKVKVGSTLFTEDIFWSALGDPDTYDTTDDHTTVPGDGQLITAVPLGNNLVLFKERSVQYLSGFSDQTFTITGSASQYNSVSEEVGCIAPRGACQVGNEVWFIDNQARIRRVLQTDFDAFRHDVISVKIQASLDNINKGQLEKAVIWTHNNKVYCAVPNGTDTVNSIVFVFDILASIRNQEDEAWTTYTGWSPSMAVSYPTDITMDLYIADQVTGAIYLHKGLDDNGVAINAVFEDGNFDYQLPEVYKNYKFGYSSGQSSISNTVVFIDSSMDGSPYVNGGTLTFTSTGTKVGPTGDAKCGPTGNAKCGGNIQTTARFFYDQNGQIPFSKRIRHRIWHNTAGQQPTVNAFTSHYKPRALR